MASSWSGYAQSAAPTRPSNEPSQQATTSKRKPQSRQLLSCTKCRERKVKCDRTKPCSACCARGHPKECQFVVGEGNDYSPIQQSYEIRKLRVEVQRLRERLQAARIHASGDESDEDVSPERAASKASVRAAAARQRRFKTSDRSENLYFGTPGLASIISDFANLSLGSHSLTHTVPKAREMYRVETSMYPFPILSGWGSDSSGLLSALPGHDELYRCIDIFQQRANATSFPHMPTADVSKKEIERFLADAEVNTLSHPDMLALLFAMLATGTQIGVWDQNGGQWVEGGVSKALAKGNLYIAASMQALRSASFLNQPTLLCIETLLLIGPYLTNSGRFLDAWTLFGTTIRIAHSIGLHRDPKYLDPVPPLRECTTRQTLWWWMLHMDQHYSVTLGRPLGISGLGDCPLPEPLTIDPTTLRLGEFVNHFTVLARQILGSDGMMSVSRIDEFTDKLMGLWDTMPEALQFNESWSRNETILPEWPLGTMSASLFAKVQSFIILLNRQRQERTMHSSSPSSAPMASRSHSIPTATTYYSTEQQLLHPAPIRGRALVINSSVQLLQTFLFFYHREAAVLICWTLGQQAFNACMILILDAWETHNDQNEWLVNQAFQVFSELDRCGVHSLANMAVRRISDGLARLRTRKQELETMNNLSRRSSVHQSVNMPFQPALSIDTTAMTNFSGDQVMGQTGMYLLEDGGLQGYQQSVFQPLGWSLSGEDTSAGASNHSRASRPPSPALQAPTVPVSNVPIAPFPVMAPPYIPTTTTIPVTNSPFALGLQPRMPNYSHPAVSGRMPNVSHARSNRPVARSANPVAFTAINQHASLSGDIAQMDPEDHHFMAQHVQGLARHAMSGKTQHRIERTPRSQQRRSAHRR